MLNNLGLIKFCLITLILAIAGYTAYFEWFDTSYYNLVYMETLTKLVENVGSNVFGIKEIYTLNTVTGAEAEIGTNYGARMFLVGADGLLMLVVMVAAIIAWPGNILKKSAYVLASIAIYLLCNIARVVWLFYIEVYYPVSFPIASKIFSPLLMAALCAMLFYCWIRLSGKHPLDSEEAH